MFGISGEHFLILAVVLLIFGPRRLPELGNTLGKAIRNFKDSIDGVEEAKFKRVQENKTATAAPESLKAPDASLVTTTAPTTATPVERKEESATTTHLSS